ncbi:arylesterase [Lichenicola sp.]|uniref:arylesterase n=1 Tax=Lichenicola sp. TaxID=2804529 RepID=UPI003B00E695
MKAPYGRALRCTKGPEHVRRLLIKPLLAMTFLCGMILPGVAQPVSDHAGTGAAIPSTQSKGVDMLQDSGQSTRTIRILALGDSLTAGFGLPHDQGFVSRLQAALDQADAHAVVLDAGVSGDTTAGGLARLDWALGDHPDAAIVELGANDGLRGLDPGQMEHNLAAILDRLAALHIPVLFSGMYAPPNLGQQYGQAFRSVFDRLSRRPGLIYDPFFLQGVAGDRALNQADGMHPAPAGVAIIVRRMTPLVLQLVQQARAMPRPAG